jgi:hypothetical protein
MRGRFWGLRQRQLARVAYSLKERRGSQHGHGFRRRFVRRLAVLRVCYHLGQTVEYRENA